jgi:thymidylate kinase
MSRLIVFEGLDASGQVLASELVRKTCERIRHNCVLLSFPGSKAGTLGRHVYELHHDASRFRIEKLTKASLQLLHIAAHIDAIESRIKPLLPSRTTVVLHRFWWSTYVYGLVGGVLRDILDGMIALRPDRLLTFCGNFHFGMSQRISGRDGGWHTKNWLNPRQPSIRSLPPTKEAPKQLKKGSSKRHEIALSQHRCFRANALENDANVA